MQPTPAAHGPLSRIVVGVDFSMPSIASAQWAARLLAPEAEVVLVYALDVPASAPWEDPARTSVVADVAEEGAQRRLDVVRATIGRERTTCVVRGGRVHRVLTAVATEREADLIVVGPHRRRHGLWDRLGTTAERLLAEARIPVLVGPARPDHPIAHVLVPDDLPDLPSAAESLGALIARRLGVPSSRLVVVPSSAPSHLLAPEVEAELAVGGARVSRRALLHAEDRRAVDGGALELEATFGEPALEILAAADRHATGLIVVGRRRHQEVRRAVLGSVTRDVIRCADCPVLVVPQ